MAKVKEVKVKKEVVKEVKEPEEKTTEKLDEEAQLRVAFGMGRDALYRVFKFMKSTHKTLVANIEKLNTKMEDLENEEKIREKQEKIREKITVLKDELAAFEQTFSLAKTAKEKMESASKQLNLPGIAEDEEAAKEIKKEEKSKKVEIKTDKSVIEIPDEEEENTFFDLSGQLPDPLLVEADVEVRI